MAACQADEEIVIVDGGSTDGTSEFLQTLFNAKKIHQFISEKDFGEAHGTNKAIMLSQGELIKIITDDDVYAYEQVAECKRFMLQHQQIDVIGSNGFYYNAAIADKIELISKTDYFTRWKKNRQPFMFTGLSLMLRRRSLSLVGLFDSNFMIIDYEYTLRITAGKANLAWFTGCTYVNIINPGSNSRKYLTRLYEEKLRLQNFYKLPSTAIQSKYIMVRSKISFVVKNTLKLKLNQQAEFNFDISFARVQDLLSRYNRETKATFLQ
jgi:glycosyltransferase involved in cell wall biosynthesis